MPLAKRKVLVTGCCGLTGRTLVAALLGAGYTVVGADILPRAAGNEALEGRALYLTCDVSSADHVYAVFEKAGPFHAVFHTAAIVPFNLVWSGSAELLRAVNVEGTRNVVEAASDSAVRHLVFASSSGVAFTGKSDLDLADESVTPAGPLNDEYSQSKADAEKVVLAASSPDKLACVALRPNGIWGPGETHHIPKVMLAAQLGGTALAMGHRGRTDFTHAENLAHAFLLALRALEGRHPSCSRERVAGQAFYITDGWRVTTMGFFSPLLAGLGFVSPLHHRVTNSDTGKEIVGFFDEGVKLSAEDEAKAVLEVAEPRVGVPHALLVAAAHAMVAICWLVELLTAGAIRLEPFLTPADCRKLWFHNCFDSSKAKTVLKWRPIVSPALGMRELVAAYRAQGYSGRVVCPNIAAMAVVLVGMGALAALAFDLGGALTAALDWASPWVPARLEVSVLGAVCRVPVQNLLWAMLQAAVVTHLCEAFFASWLAFELGLFVPGWALMVSLFGFPAVQAMLSVARTPSPSWLPAAAIAAFVCCGAVYAPGALEQCRAY
ncbi:hypothetical protein FNF27_08059 [Cafeteria roenbergensis]|uniref:3-beta hydroxysteroid dehydrogenase/isomerase domain-containing protein n=2 Tax=Cafeteria roenbergensis TaxID=33653 RepID=A0A5A8DT12_CAFRO|nr:hypothetical protein FNF27_08059 [Cafeteria roenbergensis]KAA0168576.1 hypothetical protein FNF31_00456 [Cafeteria roenbergensis]KAA0171141.1 hypothetical protein FNF28_00908 [Cafeteria roenbergensis]